MLPINIASELQRLHDSGASIRRIAIALQISRNTIRRYIRNGPPQRPTIPAWHLRALELFEDADCKGNASAIARVLRAENVHVTSRSVQRVVREKRLSTLPPPPPPPMPDQQRHLSSTPPPPDLIPS